MVSSSESAIAKNRRALQVVELVLELGPALRGAYLETIGRQDAELKRQVLGLLRALGHSSEPDGQATVAETRPACLEMPERVGPYQVLREIGRGGMSRVYLAARADEEFERQVALKVIDQGLEAPIVHQRFLAERQILASFDCPQIAKLFDGGTLPNGRPYLVMELVDGVRVDQFCAEARLTLQERLVLFRKICGAVSYAHQNLVVHRDLKPSNILVTPEREPKLLDFGIAKLLDPESFPLPLSEATRSHFRPMTPSYASPEQLLGEPITTATDVYALGVLLFQLLVGEVPHPQQDRVQQVLRERAGNAKPPKPSENLEAPAAAITWEGQDRRRLARQLRGDLDNIVAKALRPQAADRYASVIELDEDLRRYCEGEPVRATRDTPLYLLGKFLRRYRVPVAVAATVLLLVSTFAVVTLQQSRRIAEERDRANQIRLFLANVLSSADSQTRRSGSLSLKQVLDENFARLKEQPFQDPRIQADLVGLIGESYDSLGLASRAAEVYISSIEIPSLGANEKAGFFFKAGNSLISSGRIESGIARLHEALAMAAQTDRQLRTEVLEALEFAYTTNGDFANAATILRLWGTEMVDSEISSAKFDQYTNYRLSIAVLTASDGSYLTRYYDESLSMLSSQNEKVINNLAILGQALHQLGRDQEAILSYRYISRYLQREHRHSVSQSIQTGLLAESLLACHLLEQASKANAASLELAQRLVQLDPNSPRAAYLVVQAHVRAGAIQLALNHPAEAAKGLELAITMLERIVRENPIVFAKNTLVRAYLLAGRIDDARPLVRELLEKGWRRPDFMRLAAEKGVLPDPLPPPLELDLSLPPLIRAYMDSLPRELPPWQEAKDLPTIEEIIAASEEAGSAAATKEP